MARSLDVVLVAVGVAYPFLVYCGLRVLPPGIIAIVLIPILGLRLVLGQNQSGRNTLPYLLAALVVLLVAARSPMIGLKAYPVILSLALAAAFAYSLVWPPTVIEQIARLRHPDLPLEVNSYLRKVTIAWLMFFIANAAISAGTAIHGSLRLWTLYNGLISYLAIAAMFAAELLIRQAVHRRIRPRA
ncbi:MAG: COG4648 family protein [Candidatus Binataceae bacterium]